MSGTLSENAAWIRRGWEDWKKGWRRDDVPDRFRQAYNTGRRRAKDDDDTAWPWPNRGRKQG